MGCGRRNRPGPWGYVGTRYRGAGSASRATRRVGMKSLRVFAFGVAIGVLAILGSAPPAAAAGARHHGSPRTSHPASRHPRTHLRWASQSIPDPSSRPAPRPPARTNPRPISHQSPIRTKFGGQVAALESIQDNHPQMIAWRIGASQSIGHSYMDDHVISGRGPPRAGPQHLASRVCHPERRCAPCPVTESQVVLLLRTPSPELPSRFQSSSFPPEGLFGPPRAVRHEGTAARLNSPSLGEPV
jgi:hypothetical protein